MCPLPAVMTSSMLGKAAVLYILWQLDLGSAYTGTCKRTGNVNI